ncbi:hypothetical protein N7465_010224 [Penicillium sp. CMV-2018d]|nr:hypothetical protein N7465_010224 [Penicillium sp. CMV-2018d]
MAKLSTTRFTSQAGYLQGLRLITTSKFCRLVRNNEALLGQAVGEKLDADMECRNRQREDEDGKFISCVLMPGREPWNLAATVIISVPIVVDIRLFC